MSINLSDSEWKLMNHLWEQSPRTITELTAELKPETGWSKNTVITMLARLEAKVPSGTRRACGPSGTFRQWSGRRRPWRRRRAFSPRSTEAAWD